MIELKIPAWVIWAFIVITVLQIIISSLNIYMGGEAYKNNVREDVINELMKE